MRRCSHVLPEPEREEPAGVGGLLLPEEPRHLRPHVQRRAGRKHQPPAELPPPEELAPPPHRASRQRRERERNDEACFGQHFDLPKGAAVRLEA